MGNVNITRFDRFMAMLALVLPKVTSLTYDQILDNLDLLYNPNVQNMINGDAAVTVQQKVREYVRYLDKKTAAPFWLTTGE